MQKEDYEVIKKGYSVLGICERFVHNAQRWSEFKQQYLRELDHKREPVNFIAQKAMGGKVIHLYIAKNKNLMILMRL